MMEHNPADEPASSRSAAVLSLLLAAISFLFPVSVYYIGSGMGAGVTFAFCRYQQAYLGASLITLWRDIELVTSGAITGRSALVPFFWLGGILLCCAAFGFAYWHLVRPSEKRKLCSGACLMGAAVAYLGGIIAQYGFSFAGSSGFAVPIGAVFLIVAGWFVASGFPGVISGMDDEGITGEMPEEESPGDGTDKE